MGDERTVDGDEVNDTDDTSTRGIIARLSTVTTVVDRMNARLDQISTVLINPPDPDRPPIRAALDGVIAAAQTTIATAQGMLGRI